MTFATLGRLTFALCRKRKQAESVSSSPLNLTTGRTGVGLRNLVHIPITHLRRLVSAAHKIDPKLPAGNPDYDPETATYMIRYNVAKAARILDLQYITIEQTTRDILEQFKERGWLA